MMSTMIFKLGELPAKQLVLFGNKAIGLNKLSKYGFNVPSGYAISNKEFLNFLKHNKIKLDYNTMLFQPEKIRARIMNGEFPANQIKRLKEIYNELKSNTGLVIVRSSSSLEDSSEESMAGIFDSFPALVSFQAMLSSIKKCWCSLFNETVRERLADGRSLLKQLGMGVILMEYFKGDYSGVIFTADTIEMDPKTIVINIAKGECADFVSGKAKSNLYKVRKSTLKLTTKAKQPTFLKSLAKTARSIEQKMGYFQDIEWTIKNKIIYILQSRPVTTYRDKKFPVKWNNPRHKKMAWNKSWKKGPFQPVFQDLEFILRRVENKDILKSGTLEVAPRTIIFQNGYLYRSPYPPPKGHKKNRQKMLDKRNKYLKQNKNLFYDEYLPRFLQLKKKADSLLVQSLNSKSLIKLLDRSIDYYKEANGTHWQICFANPYANQETAFPELKEYLESKNISISDMEMCSLVYKETIHTKGKKLVLKMAQEVKRNKTLADVFSKYQGWAIAERFIITAKGFSNFKRLLQQYLSQFSYLPADYANRASCIEDTRLLILLDIRQLLGLAPSQFSQSINSIQKQKAIIKQKILNKLPKSEKQPFADQTTAAEISFAVVSDHSFYTHILGSKYIRTALLRIGEYLEKNNTLNNHYDIFFLRLKEIYSILSGKFKRDINKMIETRKRQHKQNEKLMPPQYIGRKPRKKKKEEEQARIAPVKGKIFRFSGMATIKKKVSGEVEIPVDPYNVDKSPKKRIFVLNTGHINITSILKKASGLIFKGGSPYEHAGILAQEMGIPAIYQLEDKKNILDKILKTGCRAVIDGEKSELILEKGVRS